MTSISRIDPLGRPREGIWRQAIIATFIILAWGGLVVLILWLHRGHTPLQPARLLAGIALLTWAGSEMIGGRDGPIWPISALGIAASLSMGYAAGLLVRDSGGSDGITGMGVICGVAAVSMLAFLVRFRLPGLVSPIVTFAIVGLFLLVYGADKASLTRIEGFSPRGVLAALMTNPAWAMLFGMLSFGAVVLARRLDLSPDEFRIACARPLHLIGAGVSALVLGRAFALLPEVMDIIALLAIWIGGLVWALRINRIAVAGTIHLAVMKPTVLALSAQFGWAPMVDDYVILFVAIILLDLALWPFLHQISQQRGWTLGPGGSIPPDRAGWMWRYWPYAGMMDRAR